MNGCPLVSVVIPVHNRARVLGRAMGSVLAQTLQDLEVVVVDDGSTDDSARAAASFEDPRIRVIRLPQNRGVSHARNTGIRESRGRFVAFLDSDDEWLPEKLERQVARIQACPPEDETLVSCWYVRYDDFTHRIAAPTRTIGRGDAFDHIVRGRVPLPSCALMPRAIVDAIGGLDETLPAFEDCELGFRLADHSTRFVEVSDVLVIKHEHGAAQMTGDPNLMLRAFLALDRKWGSRILQRCGRRAHRRWQARFLASIGYVRVRQALARGDRLTSLRHSLNLCRYALRSPGYAVCGVGLAALGFRAYDALARVKDGVARRLGRWRERPA